MRLGCTRVGHDPPAGSKAGHGVDSTRGPSLLPNTASAEGAWAEEPLSVASSRAGKPPAGPLAGTVPARQSQEWWHPLPGGRRAVSVLVRPAQPGWVALGQEPSLHSHDSQRLDVTFTVPSTCPGTSPFLEGGPRQGVCFHAGTVPTGLLEWDGPQVRGDSRARPCAQDRRLPSAQCWQVPGAASISTY